MNKTERYLLVIWRLANSSNMRLSEDGLKDILGNPSRASFYRMVAELTNGMGELPPILSKVQDDENSEVYYKFHEAGWEQLASAKKEGQFILECYKKLGYLLQSDYTKLVLAGDEDDFEDPSFSSFSKTNSKIKDKTKLKLNQKFIYLSKIQAKPFDERKKEILNHLIKALLLECEISVIYKSLSKGIDEIKRVRPLTLCHYRDDLYLLCQKCIDGKWEDRTYKLSRFTDLRVHEKEKFKYPAIKDWNPEEIFKFTSGIIRGPLQKAILRVFGHSKELLKEKDFYNNKVIKENNEFIEYECTFTSIEEFLGQVFVYAQDVEVIEPKELIDAFMKKAERALKRNEVGKKAA
jgi:predicted DNA-binding transcriptional regulator YafY